MPRAKVSWPESRVLRLRNVFVSLSTGIYWRVTIAGALTAVAEKAKAGAKCGECEHTTIVVQQGVVE